MIKVGHCAAALRRALRAGRRERRVGPKRCAQRWRWGLVGGQFGQDGPEPLPVRRGQTAVGQLVRKPGFRRNGRGAPRETCSSSRKPVCPAPDAAASPGPSRFGKALHHGSRRRLQLPPRKIPNIRRRLGLREGSRCRVQLQRQARPTPYTSRVCGAVLELAAASLIRRSTVSGRGTPGPQRQPAGPDLPCRQAARQRTVCSRSGASIRSDP